MISFFKSIILYSLIIKYTETASLSPCDSFPCKNSSLCNSNGISYFCICLNGYTGINCDIAMNFCSSNPCLNGGTCQTVSVGLICICPYGYSGAYCQIENSCNVNPCLNGGFCAQSYGKYYCICTPGYYGTNCEIYNYCVPNPCLNLGTCISLFRSFQCLCLPGYSGYACEKNASISFLNQISYKYTGDTTMLVCRSTIPIWLWFKTDFLNNTVNLDPYNNDNRFNLTVDNNPIYDYKNSSFYQSFLLIKNINKNDFGQYRCMNEEYKYADTNLVELKRNTTDYCVSFPSGNTTSTCNCAFIFKERYYVIDKINCSSKMISNIDALSDSSNNFVDYVTWLDLSYNYINNVNNEIFLNLANLESLSLSNNLLMNLEDYSFSNLESLKYLYLKDNQIRNLNTNTFNELNNLIELYLTRNQLSKISDYTFSNLNNSLSYLDLSYNKLENVDKNNFNGLTSLIELRLNNNLISEITDNSFETLGNLNTLDLSYNRLMVVKKNTFSGLNSLENLNLRSNQIVEYDVSSVSTLPKLNNLDITENPFSSKSTTYDCKNNRNYGEPCNKDVSCDPSKKLECSSNSTCYCSNLAFYDGAKCVPRKSYNSICDYDYQCISNSSCITINDSTKKCLCNENTAYWNTAICVNRSNYKESCSLLFQDSCKSNTNLKCLNNGVCDCELNYNWNGASCVINSIIKKLNGDRCTNENDCFNSLGLSCINEICSCLANKYWSNLNICYDFRQYNQYCDLNKKCASTSLLDCDYTNNVCKCTSNSYYESNTCIKYKSYGEVCAKDYNCDPIKHLVCQNGKCACSSSFYIDKTSNSCVSKKSFKTPCYSDNECKEELGLKCLQYNCICSDSQLSWSFKNQKCEPANNDFGSSCIGNDNCKSSIGLLCKKSSNPNNPIKTTEKFCDCDSNYFYDFTNTCLLKKGISSNCKSDYECNDAIGFKCINYICG